MKNRNLGKGTWITIGAPVVTEVVSGLGFDWLLFDMEHGMMTVHSLMDYMHAVSASDSKVIVRIDEMSEPLIGHVLDYGADGIMVPHVSDSETAKTIVKAMNYPPIGDRGLSTSTRSFQYGRDVPQDLNTYQQPLLLVQIEDFDGVMNAESIASVDGVDILFVGPRDLGWDLSVRPADKTFDFDEALQRVADAAKKYHKQAGILVRNMNDIPKLQSFGFTALAIGSDLGMLRSGYKQIIQK